MKDNLTIIATESALDQDKATSLLKQFSSFYETADKLQEQAKAIVVTDESQVEQMSKAKEMRKQLQEIRINTEKTRVRLKEQSLREGKAIDGMANVIKAVIVPLEEYLESQEKFIENRRKERESELRLERQKLMEEVGSTFVSVDLGTISEHDFQVIYEAAKSLKEREEAEALKAEQDRLAKEKAIADEQERIRKENEALKKEADAREAERQKELKKLEAEREKERQEAAKKQAAIEAERDKARREAEKLEKAKLAAEREELERLRKEEEEEKKAALAPDKEKLTSFADRIAGAKPLEVSTDKGREVALFIQTELHKLATEIKKRVENL